MAHLEHLLWLRKIPEPMLAEINKLYLVPCGEIAVGDAGRRLANQRLAAMGDSPQPGATVDRSPVVIVVSEICFPGMDGGADAQSHVGRPGFSGHRALSVKGSSDRVGGAGEDRKGR